MCRTVILWLLVLALPAPPTLAAERPNIVLIMADDMGWSDLGCHGGEIGTPHIDQLAADGLRFTQFYNNAVCGPTRASLLTGLYPQQVGHRGYHWNDPKDFNRCVTISELLQASGYRTMMVGKWQGRDLAVRRGFDRFFGPMCQSKISYFQEVEKNPFYLDDLRWNLPDKGFYMTEAFIDHAFQFVEEAARGKQPFFLYMAYIAPHWPLHAREAEIAPHRQKYREHGWEHWRRRRFERQREMGLIPKSWQLSPKPEGVGPWAEDQQKDWQAERMAVYAAQVANVDCGVGRIMEAIRSAGVEEDTLVMFLSDNGAAPDGGVKPTASGFGFAPDRPNDKWRSDGVPIRPGSGPANMPGPDDTFAAYGIAWANVSNTPFTRTKLTAYEGGIRTPLVVHWPRVIGPGPKLTAEVGHVIDILPTCLEVAGIDYPTSFQGRKPLPPEGKSLLPVLHGQSRDGHQMLCWNAPLHRAIRMDRWKLVAPRKGGPWELYDLESDGTETQDLAQKHPQRVEEMNTRWQAWAQRCGVKQ